MDFFIAPPITDILRYFKETRYLEERDWYRLVNATVNSLAKLDSKFDKHKFLKSVGAEIDKMPPKS